MQQSHPNLYKFLSNTGLVVTGAAIAFIGVLLGAWLVRRQLDRLHCSEVSGEAGGLMPGDLRIVGFESGMA